MSEQQVNNTGFITLSYGVDDETKEKIYRILKPFSVQEKLLQFKNEAPTEHYLPSHFQQWLMDNGYIELFYCPEVWLGDIDELTIVPIYEDEANQLNTPSS